MDRMRPRPRQDEPEQEAVPAQQLAEVRDLAALPDALMRALNSESREALERGLAAANATHPMLHAKGHVASFVGGEFVVTDLSAKRPSLPDDRFAKVRALSGLDKGERARIDLDLAVARASGRFSSWPELMKAWDAADARKDAKAVLLCAACFALYDDLRKSMAPPPPPAEKSRPAPAAERLAPRREEPAREERREEPLPKVQASMLARYRNLSDEEKARLRRHPMPRKLAPTEFPFTQDHLMDEWRRFTAASIERFKQTKTESQPDNDDQLRFAALYAGLERKAARSQQELVNIATKQLGGAASSDTAGPSPLPGASPPPPPPPPSSPSPPKSPPSPAPSGWETALERAQRHLDDEARVKGADLKVLMSDAAIMFGTGTDPRAEAQAAYEAGSKHDKLESGRAAATQKLYTAALASRVPAPWQVAKLGPWSLEREADADSEDARIARTPKASAVEELIANASRSSSAGEVTPALVHSRLRAEYASAYLNLQLGRVRPDWKNDLEEKALVQRTWLLAHATTRAARDLPTDWHGNADDLFNS